MSLNCVYNLFFYDTTIYLSLGNILFLLSLFGLLYVKNYIILLLLIDLGMLSACYNFTIFSVLFQNVFGQIYTLLLLILVTVDTAIGLSLVLILDRVIKNTSLISLTINKLK